MLRTKLAKKKLTKKMQKHLTEMDVHSMADFERTLKRQRQLAREYERNTTIMICDICFYVAERLGMKEKTDADYERKCNAKDKS